MNKELTHIGQIIDAINKKSFIELRETKNFWIDEFENKYRKTNGSEVNGTSVLVINEISSINKEVSLVMVIDRSGSMSPLVNDTIGGINSFIQQHKKDSPEAKFSLILFDNDYEFVYDNVPIAEVKEIDNTIYYVKGFTALLDAIGKTINNVKEIDPNRVFVCIVTDGFENDSKEFDNDTIKKMIKEREEAGWIFQYLGANQDAFAVGQAMGLSKIACASIGCNSLGTRSAYSAATSRSIKFCHSSGPLPSSSEAYAEALKEENKKTDKKE